MKKAKNFKKRSIVAILAIVTLMGTACTNSKVETSSDTGKEGPSGDIRSAGITDPYVNPDVKMSNLTSEEDKAALKKDLEQVGIKEAYIGDYMNYVDIYNQTVPESTLKGWNTLDKVNYDAYAIHEKWVEKYPDFMGICCRMTAFTLLRDDILVNKDDFEKIAKEALVFDMDAFENMPNKYMTEENLKTYENFFAPIPTTPSTDREEQKKVLANALKERGVEFKNPNLKLLAMVGHDTSDKSKSFLFIDHAGVIYEKDGAVYLLEKLAFQEPYQWIKFPSEEEIIKYFESKYNLDTSGQIAKPIYMINDKLI